MERLPLLADQQDRLNIQRWVEETGLGVEPRLIRAAFVVRGPLDVKALVEAFRGVRARHSALRVGFPERGLAGYSFVTDKPADALDIIDLPGGELEEAISLVHARVSENGDLDTCDVFRARLVRINATNAVLGISVDHLVVDGQSFETVQRDLWELYTAARLQRAPNVSEVSFTYEDYVRWESSWLASEAAERLLLQSDTFLEGVGANPPALLEGTVRDRNRGYEVGTVTGAVPEDAVEALRSYSRDSGKTMFVVMVSSMLAALSAGTGQDQVGTMIPVVRRATRAMADVVAYSSSYTSIPGRIADDLTFDELTSQLRVTVVQALRIGLLPGPAITRRWNPEFLGRLLPRPSAFFDLASWTWQSDDTTMVGDLSLEPIDLPDVADGGMIESLEVVATITHKAASLDAVYPADVYPQQVVAEFLGNWSRIAAMGAANPGLTLGELRAR